MKTDNKEELLPIIDENGFKIFAAPLQGYTDVPWRHFHAELYGGIDAYFTPFIRVERGEIRQRDLKALSSPLNGTPN